MPDYRWGIFLNPAEADRRIGFGDHKGEPAWQEVPGEYRANLRRIIVTQGDTEPASVEQQRHLGLTAPSLYDLRNLFQINVEEGRHLWAMVYLLHRHFGRDGREEAEALLERRSGDQDNPRILGRVQRTHARLAVVLHVHLLHRSRRQVPALRAGRVGLRSARAHDEVHADRRGASHVRGRVRHRAHPPAHLRDDDAAQDRRSGEAAQPRRDRPADDPALPQLPLQRDHRPVRRRPVLQRRHVLQHRHQGALRGIEAGRRPPAQGRDLPGAGGVAARRSSRAKHRRSMRSTRSCATTTSATPWPASVAGTRSCRRTASTSS